MQKALLDSLLFAIGGLVFLVSLSSDLFYEGSPGIGYYQFAGIGIGLILLLIGLKHVLFLEQSVREWLLFLIYLFCIAVASLWPNESLIVPQDYLFGLDTFSKRDFAFNVIGFIPLGFLMLPMLIRINIVKQKVILVGIAVILGFFTSLSIEAFQYFWIAGRFSSAYDLAANTFGIMIGAVCYFLLRNQVLVHQKGSA